MINQEQLIALEKQIWGALVSGDALVDSQLLSDDFLGVYPSGFEGRVDHIDQLKSGPTIREFQLSDFKFKRLSSEVALLSYRSDYSRKASGLKDAREIMFVSSIWQNFDGRWLNIFSQDTVGNNS